MVGVVSVSWRGKWQLSCVVSLGSPCREGKDEPPSGGGEQLLCYLQTERERDTQSAEQAKMGTSKCQKHSCSMHL